MQDQQAYNRQLIEAFRASRGKPDGPFEARPLLLLTTIGARSGQPRTIPLMYFPDEERLLVLASNFGAPIHPDWYHNLLVHPSVTVEVGSETYRATAALWWGSSASRSGPGSWSAARDGERSRQQPVSRSRLWRYNKSWLALAPLLEGVLVSIPRGATSRPGG